MYGCGFADPDGHRWSILYISLVLCVWLLSNSGWREGHDTLIAAGIGLILYFVYMLKRRGSLSNADEFEASDTPS